jgi:hypothetical protein
VELGVRGAQRRLVDEDYASPFLYQALVPSSLAAALAVRYGVHGPGPGGVHRPTVDNVLIGARRFDGYNSSVLIRRFRPAE